MCLILNTMPSFDHQHYVPILKGKAGEFEALHQLDPGLKDRITPLIEVAPPPWDYDLDAPTKTLTQHFDGLAERLVSAWGADYEIFLDLAALDSADRLDTGVHPVAGLFDDTRAQGLQAIPTTGPDRDADYQTAVRDVATADGRGAAVRLRTEDIGDLTTLAAALDDLAHALDLEPGQLDLILDFGEITAGQAGTAELAARALLPTLPRLNEWRTLTLAAGAMPQTLTSIPTSTTGRLQRLDWILWRNLISGGQLPRQPAYGDYGIAHVAFLDFDPRFMQITAAIRYTTGDDWLIVRGATIKKAGGQQWFALAAQLTGRPEFAGSSHCQGDDFIDQCGGGTSGPGNLTTWRTVGTVHHLTVVDGQIASLP